MNLYSCLLLMFMAVPVALAQPPVEQRPKDIDEELAREINLLNEQIEELSAKRLELTCEQKLRQVEKFSEKAAQQRREETEKNRKSAKVQVRGGLMYVRGTLSTGYPNYVYGPGYRGELSKWVANSKSPDRCYLSIAAHVPAEAQNWLLDLPSEELRKFAQTYAGQTVIVKGNLWQTEALSMGWEQLLPFTKTFGVASMELPPDSPYRQKP